MFRFVQVAIDKLKRDQKLSWRILVDKSITYVAATALAPFYLRGASQVGDRVRTLGGGPRLVNYGFMSIGNDVRISSYVVPVELCASEGAELIIADGAHINYGVSIGATKSIRIGKRVRLGPYTRIVDSDFHDVYNRAKPAEPKPVVIDDDAWLGMNVIVLPGVHIGKAAVVGSGSVVTKDIPAYSVAGGVPAKVLRQLDPEKFVPDVTSGVPDTIGL